MRKIVIIEDNLAIARLYENKLKGSGNTVSIALDGEEGLRMIYEIKPELVLLDLLLPNKSGIEIIKEIRADYRFENLPIMAYSSASEDILAQAAEAGSTTIISKNEASFKEILEQFNQLLEASRSWKIYDPANFKDDEKSVNSPQNQLLVVEDDPMTTLIIKDIAAKIGLNPVIAVDGQEAYRLLSAGSNFSAAILDVELPKIKGIDLLKYMRSEKRLRFIPVIVMTSSSDYIKLQVESIKSGATSFISKPFERAMLETLIKTLTGI